MGLRVEDSGHLLYKGQDVGFRVKDSGLVFKGRRLKAFDLKIKIWGFGLKNQSFLF